MNIHQAPRTAYYEKHVSEVQSVTVAPTLMLGVHHSEQRAWISFFYLTPEKVHLIPEWHSDDNISTKTIKIESK